MINDFVKIFNDEINYYGYGLSVIQDEPPSPANKMIP